MPDLLKLYQWPIMSSQMKLHVKATLDAQARDSLAVEENQTCYDIRSLSHTFHSSPQQRVLAIFSLTNASPDNRLYLRIHWPQTIKPPKDHWSWWSHTDIQTHTHAYVHTCIHTHIYIYIYMYICACVSIHIYPLDARAVDLSPVGSIRNNGVI